MWSPTPINPPAATVGDVIDLAAGAGSDVHTRRSTSALPAVLIYVAAAGVAMTLQWSVLGSFDAIVPLMVTPVTLLVLTWAVVALRRDRLLVRQFGMLTAALMVGYVVMVAPLVGNPWMAVCWVVLCYSVFERDWRALPVAAAAFAVPALILWADDRNALTDPGLNLVALSPALGAATALVVAAGVYRRWWSRSTRGR